MKTIFVKSVPVGDFAEVSVFMDDWETRFQTLIGQKQSIKFDMYPKSGIPDRINECLGRQGYHDLVIDNDRWQHYLVPDSKVSLFRTHSAVE